jgi:hypothetical protein
MLQINVSTIYVIKLPQNFDNNFTFDIKDLVIYKIQQSITDDLFETSPPLSLSLTQKKHINAILDVLVVLPGMMNCSESQYKS